MRNEELERQLRKSFQQSYITADENRLKNIQMLAGREILRRKERERISFSRFLLMQVKFIGWKVWTLQLFFLLMINRAFVSLYGRENPRYLIKLLACLSILVLMMALPFLYRSVRYRMQEVETASRFSAVKLLTARLVMIGIGDLFLLGGIFSAATWKTSLGADSVFLSLSFPFLFAGSGCLYLLGHCKAKQFLAGSMGLCLFFILSTAFGPGYDETPAGQFLTQSLPVICGMLAIFCICQFRYILYRSTYAEMQIA